MWRLAAVLAVLAMPALADAPDTSLFPRARPAAVSLAVDTAIAAATAVAVESPAPAEQDTTALAASPRPRARPETTAAPVTAVSTASASAATPAPRQRRGFLAGLFGPPRARPAEPGDAAPAPSGNFVCGDPAIIGRQIDPIGSPTQGCGIAEPVQITAIDGITLSQPSTVDCATATALRRWIDEGLRPAFGENRVAGLQIAGHYVCRPRNNIRGARISEHGRGKAIDVSAIILGNGQVLTVQDNWNSAMRAAYRAGCGIFGTTLGPGSDGYHEDHMHFDTADHRNGAYCR
jgi:hypothetical protein